MKIVDDIIRISQKYKEIHKITKEINPTMTGIIESSGETVDRKIKLITPNAKNVTIMVLNPSL